MNLCVGIQTQSSGQEAKPWIYACYGGLGIEEWLQGDPTQLSHKHTCMHTHTHTYSLSRSLSHLRQPQSHIHSATIPDSKPIWTLFVFPLLQLLSLADTDVGLFIKVRQQEIPGISRGLGTHWRGKMRPSLPCRDPCYVALHWQPKACSLWPQTIQTQPLKSPRLYRSLNPRLTQMFQSQKITIVGLATQRERQRERVGKQTDREGLGEKNGQSLLPPSDRFPIRKCILLLVGLWGPVCLSLSHTNRQKKSCSIWNALWAVLSEWVSGAHILTHSEGGSCLVKPVGTTDWYLPPWTLYSNPFLTAGTELYQENRLFP